MHQPHVTGQLSDVAYPAFFSTIAGLHPRHIFTIPLQSGLKYLQTQELSTLIQNNPLVCFIIHSLKQRHWSPPWKTRIISHWRQTGHHLLGKTRKSLLPL